MSTIEHTLIADQDLHEPKGISTATANQIYIANGSGSGSWQDLGDFVVLPIYPVGSVIDFAGTTVPNGWMLCDGRTLARSSYINLYSTIGVTYGAGDGSTSFQIPDCRGRITVGKDNMGGASANRITIVDGDILGTTGGSEYAQLVAADIPELTGTTNSAGTHTHNVTNGTNVMRVNGAGGYNAMGIDPISASITYTSDITAGTGGSHTHTVSINPGSNNARHNNVQPTIIMKKIIFTGVFS